MTQAPTFVDSRVRRWRAAVLLVFLLGGTGTASWVSRAPAIRDGLGLSLDELGLVLSIGPAGAIVGFTLAARVLGRFGAARGLVVGTTANTAGLALIGTSATTGMIPLAAAGFLLFGFGNGLNNVTINVEGAAVERALRRTVMPMFHAMWSIGGFVGAGIGAIAALAAIPVVAHLSVMGAVVLSGALVASRLFPPLEPVGPSGQPKPRLAARVRALIERRTLLIGVIVLGGAFAESSANGWLAIAMVDERDVDEATGAALFAVFAIAMTTGRVAGGRIIDRFGRVAVLRSAYSVAVVGLVLVIAVDSLAVSVVGIVLWGLGASVGFPVGMSAAADDPVRAARRVSAVSSVASISFLIGPTVIGFIAERLGLLLALGVPVALLAIAVIAATAAAPLREAGPADAEGDADR